jgi:Ser/Thr protein kinase RdoA (MazF antagonist)
MPEGTRYGVLLSYVAGNMTACTLETSYLIGQQLALLHDAFDVQTNNDDLHIYNEDSLIKKPFATILKAMQTSRNGSIEQLKKCNSAISALPMPRLSRTAYGLCHGDAHFNNTVISNGGKIEFIDFDLCGYGARTYDLATLMWKIELRTDTRAQKSRTQLALLRGYEHVRELTDEEKISIPTFMAWRHIFWLGAQAKLLPNLYGYLLLSNDYYKTHLGWLENWIAQGHSDCTKMILSGELQLQPNDTVSITDLQIEWWQKQRTGLIPRLIREASLRRDVMHFAHLHSEDNLVTAVNIAESSAHLTNAI